MFEELVSRINRLEKNVFGKSDIFHKIQVYEKEKEKGTLKKLHNTKELFS